jgi:hypothetical protein
MLPRATLSALVLALAFASSACLGEGHSINAYAGKRTLEASDWNDVDNPTVYGIDGVLKVNLPWLGVEGGWFHTEENGSTVGSLTSADLAVDEYFVGLRVTPWKILIEPYGSVGVSWVDSKLDATGTSDSDQVLAYYVRVGAAFTIGLFRVGLDGRALLGSDVNLDTISSDVDGYYLTAFVGVGF